MRPIDADALKKDYRRQFEAVYKHTRSVVLPSDFYIEREAAYNKELMRMEMEAFFKYLQSRPTIDAVEVVRCKDCVDFVGHGRGYVIDVQGADGFCYCRMVRTNDQQFAAVTYDDFCSYGRRKDAEVEV